MSIVFVSGGFDCCHSGHIEYLREASTHGKVVVLLNSDEWLKRKKGYALLPFQTRWDVLKAIRYVDAVYEFDDSDGTANDGLRRYAPTFLNAGQRVYFAKGGDRTKENTPEQEQCEWLGIEILWNVGGGKVQSSSELVQKVMQTA